MTAGRVDRERLGAWLLKANPRVGSVPMPAGPGAEPTDWAANRCVADNYRSRLMVAGDPVVLWLSGPSSGTRGLPTPGIWGIGQLTGQAVPGADGLQVPVQLRLGPDVLVSRDELRTHPLLGSIEVLTMPAGSNPSWLDRDQWEALQQLAGGWRRA